jgi:microcystin-dependent protein
MAQPYVGEIRMFAGNFNPAGWMFCDGQLLPISENETLFQLIGTTYGGDGQSTFALPNLQSRLPVHMGTGAQLGVTFQLAAMSGSEGATLTTNQIPVHSHSMLAAAADGQAVTPTGNLLANSGNVKPYINASPDGDMNVAAIGPTGASQPHTNLQPFLCINFIISLFGNFPSPT